MANIGGNITGTVQTKAATGKNEIGEAVFEWADAYNQPGWLGLQSGDSKRSVYNAKIEESTHVFLCDYHAGIYGLTIPDASGTVPDVRMMIKGMVYDVLLIDNPDEMNEQLEIYLKKVGAWNG